MVQRDVEDVCEHVDQLVSTFLNQPSWNVVWACSFPFVALPQGSPHLSGFKRECTSGWGGSFPRRGAVQSFKPFEKVIELIEGADVILAGCGCGFIVSLFSFIQVNSILATIES